MPVVRTLAGTTSPVSSTTRVHSLGFFPKSGWLSEWSRYTTGTRNTSMPFTCSGGGKFCTQVKPGSMVQVLEQPSPLIWLPSSHSSLIKRPSPHCEVQSWPPGQLGSATHTSEQPSKGTTLPSSQLSAPSMMLSPQTVGRQTPGSPSQVKPCSNLQRSEHPSPGSRLPSSHCSDSAFTPSPHTATLRQGCPSTEQLNPGSSC